MAYTISSAKIYQVASSYQKAFQELVNTYESLGDSIPLLLQYQELFRTKPHMTRVLSLMYEDILNFHRLAMKYFQQRRTCSCSCESSYGLIFHSMETAL